MEEPPQEPIHRFSMVELLAATAAIAVGLAWPATLPCVAALILIRVGLGLFQAIFVVLLGMAGVLWASQFFS